MLRLRIEVVRDPKDSGRAAATWARIWTRFWAFLRGPGLAAASDALKTAETLLSKAWAWLETALRPTEPAPEPPPRRQTPANLRFSDLDLDEPEDALHALCRAARVPPHRRHIDTSHDDEQDSSERFIDR